MDKYISIKEASMLFGVTTTTLRRWEKSGRFLPNHKTFSEHRRYSLLSIYNIIDPSKQTKVEKTVCYSRVSSQDQKDDLTRQTQVLEKYIKINQIKNVEYINDIGSGLNFKKKGLKKLISLIISNQITKIVLTHKDRLLRFGSDLLISIAKQFDVETVILNNETKTFEQELASDVLEIITVFSAKHMSHEAIKIKN